MLETQQRRYLPSGDRLSILTATILLAYAMTPFIDLPERELAVQLPGLYLSVMLDARAVISLLAAGLTASGMHWLIRNHPAYAKQNTIEHWLLPALSAWVVGFPLSQLTLGWVWWASFALSGLLLITILIAEYVAVDPEDLNHPVATTWLTAISFTLYLVLAAALRYSGSRLFMVLGTLSLAGWLVSLRTLHLRLHGRWAFLPAGVITLITIQMAAALHYWPLSPVAYGLALLGPAYALTNLVVNLGEGEPLRRALIEPAIVLALVWATALLAG